MAVNCFVTPTGMLGGLAGVTAMETSVATAGLLEEPPLGDDPPPPPPPQLGAKDKAKKRTATIIQRKIPIRFIVSPTFLGIG